MPTGSRLLKRQQRLYLVFKVAIEEERRAQERYREAQKFCDNADLKEVLRTIMKEELVHEKTLLGWYARLKTEIGVPPA